MEKGDISKGFGPESCLGCASLALTGLTPSRRLSTRRTGLGDGSSRIEIHKCALFYTGMKTLNIRFKATLLFSQAETVVNVGSRESGYILRKF
jgi:hypothetical protein